MANIHDANSRCKAGALLKERRGLKMRCLLLAHQALMQLANSDAPSSERRRAVEMSARSLLSGDVRSAWEQLRAIPWTNETKVRDRKLYRECSVLISELAALCCEAESSPHDAFPDILRGYQSLAEAIREEGQLEDDKLISWFEKAFNQELNISAVDHSIVPWLKQIAEELKKISGNIIEGSETYGHD